MREQAEQCGEMLKRLGVLAEAETDEATLQQTLELHSALEQAMAQYDVLLAVAEARLVITQSRPVCAIACRYLDTIIAPVLQCTAQTQVTMGGCHSRGVRACSHAHRVQRYSNVAGAPR